MDEKHFDIYEGIALDMTREQHDKTDITKAEFSSTMHICVHRLMRHTFGGTFYSTESMECMHNVIKRWMRTQLMEHMEDPQRVKINIKVYCIIEYTVLQWFATRTVRGLKYRPDGVRYMSEVLNLNEGFQGVYAEKIKMLIKDFIKQECDEEVLKELGYMTKDTEEDVYEEYLTSYSSKREKRSAMAAAIGGAVLGWIVSEIGGRLLKLLEEFIIEQNKGRITKLDEFFKEWDESFHINTLCTCIENIVPQGGAHLRAETYANLCFERIKTFDQLVIKPRVVSTVAKTSVISVETWESAKLALVTLFTPLLQKLDKGEVVDLIAYKLRRANVKISHKDFCCHRRDIIILEQLEGKDKELYKELSLLQDYDLTIHLR